MPRQSAPPLDVSATCLTATRSELERLNAMASPEAQVALALAEILDSGRSLMAAAANAKQLLAVLDAVRERSPKAKDSVDDFTARRAARRSA